MLVRAAYPTPYPEVNAVLSELLSGAQSILGNHLIGMYLDGSLASGDFDQDSDIDFVVVTDEDVSEDDFLALQAMHERIATMDSWCATQLEGTYISQSALERHDQDHALHPNIERGKGQHLKMVKHDDAWIIHRYILREYGITIVGPAPETLLTPISPSDLRKAMLAILHEWATPMLDVPSPFDTRGYQSFTVLSLCRILYTLHYGSVSSKLVAARWVQETLDERWTPLIGRAWVGRHNPGSKPELDDVNETRNLIRYTLEYSQQFETPR